jgi:predicted ATPase
MLSWELHSYRMAESQPGPVFFDRGVPDVVGYLQLMNLPVPPHMTKAVETFRYNRRVFFAPPWPEIFAQDRERKQTWDEAVQTCEALRRVYTSSGYELVELPCCPVDERLAFVLDKLKNNR